MGRLSGAGAASWRRGWMVDGRFFT